MPTKTEAPREAWFYHLERQSVAEALPELLEKTLAKGWRALVRSVDEDVIASLDDTLWSHGNESFLAHGRADAPHAERQPILLTREEANVNGAQALFVLDEPPAEVAGFERCVVLFDGRDESSLARARRLWSSYKAAGSSVTYWKQQETRGWVKSA